MSMRSPIRPHWSSSAICRSCGNPVSSRAKRGICFFTQSKEQIPRCARDDMGRSGLQSALLPRSLNRLARYGRYRLSETLNLLLAFVCGVREKAARRQETRRDGSNPHAHSEHRIVHARPNSDPHPRRPTAEAAHDPAEERTGQLFHRFGNSNRRLTVAREHGHRAAAFRRLRLPQERTPDRRDLTDLARAVADHVDQQIEILLRHLAVDDDLVLDVHVAAREQRLRPAAVNENWRTNLGW